VKKRLIFGNWKLYIEEADEAKKLALALKRKMSNVQGIDCAVFPPAPFLTVVASALNKSSIGVGAQAVDALASGAYTGYMSPRVVRDAGAQWTLVGHSERRARMLDGTDAAGESDARIAAEVRAALDAGLKVVLCVGEEERDAGGAHFGVIAQQVSTALAGLPDTRKLVVAYEPVWAIGKTSADAMKPADLEEMAIFIRRTLTELFDRTSAAKIPILYGGSVDASNAHELLAQAGVSGFLVGRASTTIKTFNELLDICKA
jgi:triosephosphate isomerase